MKVGYGHYAIYMSEREGAAGEARQCKQEQRRGYKVREERRREFLPIYGRCAGGDEDRGVQGAL